MWRNTTWAVACALFLSHAPTEILYAQQTAAQTFTVHKPATLVVSGSLAPLEAELDPRETVHQFPQRIWSVDSSSPTGVAVEFALEQSDVLQDGEMDVELQLSLDEQSSRAWRITRDRDRTHLSHADQQASVAAFSQRSGPAQLALAISFLNTWTTSTGEETQHSPLGAASSTGSPSFTEHAATVISTISAR